MMATLSYGSQALLFLVALVLFLVGGLLAALQRALPLALGLFGLAAWVLVPFLLALQHP